MKFSNATNYALHTMVFLLLVPEGQAIAVQELADLQKLSPTYLSKILGKLSKGGLISASSGANGGYKIVKEREQISFLDVVKILEGEENLFHCFENQRQECLIEQVMVAAEKEMTAKLETTYLINIAREMDGPEHKVSSVLQTKIK